MVLQQDSTRAFRNVDELIQSHLSELLAPGLVVVRDDLHQLDVYTAHGSGMDLKKPAEALKTFKWVQVISLPSGWISRDLLPTEIESYLQAMK